MSVNRTLSVPHVDRPRVAEDGRRKNRRKRRRRRNKRKPVMDGVLRDSVDDRHCWKEEKNHEIRDKLQIR